MGRRLGRMRIGRGETGLSGWAWHCLGLARIPRSARNDTAGKVAADGAHAASPDETRVAVESLTGGQGDLLNLTRDKQAVRSSIAARRALCVHIPIFA